MAVKQILSNCKILYGNDSVTIGLRREEIIRDYFHGEIPEVTVLDSPGNYDLYRSCLEGQSLFAAKTAVVMENPFFIKRPPKDKKEENEFNGFINILKELTPDTLAIFTVDGALDKRTKASKTLLSVCGSEECSLLAPREGASVMARMLMDCGKRVEPEARAYMEEVIGSWETISRPFLQTECDKIVLMAGNRTDISKKLLEYALPEYMDQGIFKFTDALIAKNASAIIENTDRVFTGVSETIKNLGFISAKFRKIKILKEMQRNHVPLPQIQKAAGVTNQWAWKNLEKDARFVSEEDAEWMLLNIFEYHWGIREGSAQTVKELLLRYCMRK